MASNEFKYTIRAEDRSREAVRSATRGMSSMESNAKKLGNVLKGAFTVTAVIAAGRAITRVAGDLIDAYAKQEQAERKLAQAVANNPFMDERNINALQDYASELQNITTVGDETTLELMSMAAAWGRNEDEIKTLVTAAADLSAGLGMDLTTAARGLNNVMEGNVTTLSRYIPSLRNLTQEQIESGEAMKIINEQFGGMAEAMRNTTGGALESFNNSWGDLKENLGGLFNDVLLPVIEALTVIINKLNEAFARRDARVALRDALEGYADVQSIQLAILAQERAIADAQEKAREAREALGEAREHGHAVDVNFAMGDFSRAANELAEQENIMAWLLDYQSRLEAMLPEQVQVPDLSLGTSSTSTSGSGGGSLPSEWQGFGEIGGVIHRAGFTIGQELIPAVEEAAFTIGEDLVTSHVLMQGSMKDTVEETKEATSQLQFFGAELGRIGEGIEANEGFWSPQEFNLDGLTSHLGDSLAALDASAMSAVMGLASIAAVATPLNTIFDMMLQALQPLIDAALNPLLEAFRTIAMTLAANLVPYFEVLVPLIAILATVLEAMAPLFAAFGEIIKMLVPVIKAFATPLVILATTFQWLINVVANFGDFLASVAAAPLKPWKWKGGNRDTNLGAMIAGAVGSLWDDAELPGLATPDIPTGTTGTPAQYTTGRNITVNVDINTGYYFGNEREFAIAIRDEIRAAEALGA